MAKLNYWNECYDGQAKRTMPEEQFRQGFCRFCRNHECSLALAAQTHWQARMETQEDRLLTNPNFADPKDPKYRMIRDIDFPDMLRQAMALEISSQRGDWEVPTQADAMQLATTGRVIPPPPEPPPAPEPEAEEPEEEEGSPLQVHWEGRIKGDSGKTYQVLLSSEGPGKPAWSCSCPAFMFQKAEDGLCKHIHMVIANVSPGDLQEPEPPAPPPTAPSAPIPEPEPEPIPAPVAPAVPAPRNQFAEPGPRQAPFIPRMQNTPSPNDGLMVGGADRPEPPQAKPIDPWAVAPKPDNVVPVGGKVRMGLTGKTKKDS
ncbi:SWIM zinc finger domain-containing protein [Deltaproteobacteria bacterium]|nr:SWIM zinc finger domain-containing protein [Deltaproteobacteria bacterium]